MPDKMRKIPITITALSEYGWMGGLGLNEYVGRKNSYSTQSDGGIDPFRKPGVLQAGFKASVANSFISTQINALETYLASGALKLYGNGFTGRVYQLDTANHANVSVIASLSNNNADHGFSVFRDYLWSAYNPNSSITQLTRIGPLSLNLNTTNINISMISQVQGVQIKHVIVPWKSNLYCLHANNLDYLDGNGVTTGILTIGARLPNGMVVKTATSYGEKLAIGASDNLISGSNRGARCIVYFYDGVSNDWQKEIPFPENDIFNLSFEHGELLAWGLKWLYQYDAAAGGFKALEPLDTSAPGFHRYHSTNDGQVWFTGTNVVHSYGSPIRYLDRIKNTPYTAVGTGGVVKWISNSRLYVSNNSGNLNYLSASAETGVTAYSRVIDVGGSKFRVAWCRVVTETLATNDTLILKLRDNAGNISEIGTFTFANDGAVMSKEFHAKDFTADPGYVTEVQWAATFDGGNVKLRRIDMILETANEY